MLTPTANAEQKWVKNSEQSRKKFAEIVSRFWKTCHDFMPRKTQLSTFQNRATVTKSCHDFDSIRSKKQLFKNAISTILSPSEVHNRP